MNIDTYKAHHKFLVEYKPEIGGQLNEITQIDLVKDITGFLNRNYEKGEQTEITTDGKFNNKKIIGVKTKGDDGKMEIVTNISPSDLFYRLEDEFKGRLDKGEKREAFLKQCIIDWYNSYDGLNIGNLSKNLSI